MPKSQLKIEGRGNGIKTNIINLHEIAKALNFHDECLDIYLTSSP
ncbi:unnamed protein product (macronuclear) [Paramecium tetraurelia]|uniref:Uncharacterized protein n=1 Tax=Paramecium tetraurelia TaxID=5888 RepID=A0EGP8_PARTE|nr:uncharacterized protein GSPATT00026813001 [Paramecium tetraurelia]CAK94489.1 unnamed protein product [Paramecium tetraurelia]|eukprot:XP_001461862.1 hypothetical protein (macronuclear) [Paramecium tetraurelia strain d4-2]